MTGFDGPHVILAGGLPKSRDAHGGFRFLLMDAKDFAQGSAQG
ncbi:MAG: hypothetical protein WC876_04030 [Candidatus Thermoplasmatota archaeon]